MDDRFADAVIVAAGSSTRMGGLDKLAEPLLGRPLLAWAVDAMARAQSVGRIVVVTRPAEVDTIASARWLAEAGEGRAEVVAGGEHRSDSVRAGVAAVDAPIVLVHDGARPLASARLADNVARAAAEHGAAVPVVPVADSLKRGSSDQLLGSVDRQGVLRAQTPQGVRRNLLMDAFAAASGRPFSDEAELLESFGAKVATIPGETANIKVTDEHDLEMVRAIARGRGEERVGFGEDSHGFGPNDGLMLGGVLLAGAPRLHGHSDGDVVLHALATAVLSASGLGDLGRLFPASDNSTAGIASARLLGEAVAQAASAGWAIDRAQVSIVGARPRLGSRMLDDMRDAAASTLGIPPASVSVTASTGNLSGDAGAGRVIRATALVTVIRR